MKKNKLLLQNDLLKESFEKELLSSQVDIQESTFDFIGKELHDNVSQLLSSAKMLIGITERTLNPVPRELIAANETLDKAILELRTLSKSLNKEWLEKYDLRDELTALLRTIRISGKLQVYFRCNTDIPLLPAEQYMLFRLVQEGISNVTKHAGAEKLYVLFCNRNENINILLIDDGNGFDIKKERSGMGINNMKQRTISLGGNIRWESGITGTKVILSIPFKKTSHGIRSRTR